MHHEIAITQNEFHARGYRRILGLGYLVPQYLVPSPEISFRYNRALESRSKSSRSQFIQKDCRLVRPTRLVRFHVLVAEEPGSIEIPRGKSPGGNYKAFVELLRLLLREDSQSQRSAHRRSDGCSSSGNRSSSKKSVQSTPHLERTAGISDCAIHSRRPSRRSVGDVEASRQIV